MATIRISWHGFDFTSDKLPVSAFCEDDVGAAMSRAGHQEDLVWRGCLVASDTATYMQRYIKINDIFNQRPQKIENTRSCISCHDGNQAATFAQMWTYFPRYNVNKQRLEDFAQAIKDEIEYRYGGTRPDRYDILVSTLYNYAFTKAKLAGYSFRGEVSSHSEISETRLQTLRITKKCREIFASKGLPKGPNADYVVKGCNIITDTANHVPALLKIWRTDVKCQSCHREAGTKPYAAPLAYGAVLLPMISTRAYKPIRFHRRALMCFARSLNWLDLGRDSPIPTYIRMYANWLAQKDQLVIGVIYPGRGIPMIYDTAGLGSSILAGEKVFTENCVMCHGENGWGGQGKIYQGEEPPPISGPYSFNATATTARRPRLAGFIFNNMPPGATHEAPILTKQQALDVSLYLQSLGRPADFVHSNQIATFFNYMWQNAIYYGYKVLDRIRNFTSEEKSNDSRQPALDNFRHVTSVEEKLSL